jgi:hypothetical protein
MLLGPAEANAQQDSGRDEMRSSANPSRLTTMQLMGRASRLTPLYAPPLTRT